MEGADAPDPHVAGPALEGGVVAFGLSEIVAGGEEVAGVEADPDALRNLDGAEEQGELLEGPADGRAAARGVLEEDHDAIAARPRDHLVEGSHDAADALVEPLAAMGAGMDDHEGQAEGLRALELVLERRHRPLPLRLGGRGEVDQVARVGEDGPHARRLPCAAEASDIPLRKRHARPPGIVFEKVTLAGERLPPSPLKATA